MKNKAIWIGGLIGFVYGLVPLLIFAIGSPALYMSPIFQFFLVPFLLISMLLALPTLFNGPNLLKQIDGAWTDGVTVGVYVVNILLCVLIGMFIGWTIKKRREYFKKRGEKLK